MEVKQSNDFIGTNKEKGYSAEDTAADYLVKKGYEIIKRNFTFGKTGEIDIIAKHKNTLVFIEVKARANDKYGNPLDSITPGKQRKIRKTAEGYLYVNKIYDVECRFDVVSIDYIQKHGGNMRR